MKIRFRHVLVTLVCAGMLTFAAAARAQEISVFSTATYKEVLHEILPHIAQAYKHKVVTRFSSSTDILKCTEAGEQVDVVIRASDWREKLIHSGRNVPDSRVDLVKSGISVAVRAGVPKPDIRSSNAVKRAILAARSVRHSGGASGTYMVVLFQRLEIAEEMKAKSRQTPPGVAVGEPVARGEVKPGFHQLSELLPVAGIEILGSLPPELQQVTVFSSGNHVAARDPAAARALVHFLASPQAISLIRKNGMEPG